MLILELIGEKREGRVVSRTLAGWRRARALLSAAWKASSRPHYVAPTWHRSPFILFLQMADLLSLYITATFSRFQSLACRVVCSEYADIFNANPAAEYKYIYKPMRQQLPLAALKHYSWTIRHGFIVFNKNHVRLMHIIGWVWRNCDDDCQFQFYLLFCNKEALIR